MLKYFLVWNISITFGISNLKQQFMETKKQVNKVLTLEQQIELLNEKVIQLQKSTDRLSERISKYDFNSFLNLDKRYGFSENKMYYIGAATAKMYVKPIHDEYAAMIGRINKLEWQEIVKLNKYFMQK